jgi:conjugal transfer pilus assembly protein TrbC
VKLLNILTVMLLLTRTFARAGAARQIRWRQIKWLKQQEDFSEQLRQHPDNAAAGA